MFRGFGTINKCDYLVVVFWFILKKMLSDAKIESFCLYVNVWNSIPQQIVNSNISIFENRLDNYLISALDLINIFFSDIDIVILVALLSFSITFLCRVSQVLLSPLLFPQALPEGVVGGEKLSILFFASNMSKLET